MQLNLKAISRDGIAEAISKAEVYRYLNEPGEAESICRDILAVESDNQAALRLLGLAITDQFNGGTSDRYAGPFDPIQDRLFVAQFRNLTDVPSLSIGRAAGVTRITFVGVLQSSTTVNGVYANVVGATSPYTVPAGPAATYYRVAGSLTER